MEIVIILPIIIGLIIFIAVLESRNNKSNNIELDDIKKRLVDLENPFLYDINDTIKFQLFNDDRKLISYKGLIFQRDKYYSNDKRYNKYRVIIKGGVQKTVNEECVINK